MTFVAIGALRAKMLVIATGIMQYMISVQNYTFCAVANSAPDSVHTCINYLSVFPKYP